MCMNLDLDFKMRKQERDFDTFCKEMCQDFFDKSYEEEIEQTQSKVVYSDIDHSLVCFDLTDGKSVYFKVFHSENEERYEAVPVVIHSNDNKFVEVDSVKEAIRKNV